jgi:arylsulfatase A-like enzyme
MTTESESPTSGVILDVFPLGFALGGILASARALLAGFGSAPGWDQQAVSYRVLALAERWPELLAEAMIAGVVCSLVLTFASSAQPRKSAQTWIALGITFLASAAFLTGYPEVLPGISVGSVGAAVGAALMAFGLSRIPFTGVLPLILGVAVGFGLPYAAARYVKENQEGMPVRRVIVDLVATQMASAAGVDGVQGLKVVEQRGDAPVTAAVLTPIVDLHTDTGDKPTLIMPPPAAVEFTVPNGSTNLRFQAAVNLDDTSINSLPAEIQSLPVTYRVLVDGDVQWETTFQHERVKPPWNAGHMVWRHVESDGERGVPVLPGQTVRLETKLAEGVDASKLGKDQLKLGFGGAALVQHERKPRLVPTPHAPNVIYVVIDTQRRDRLGTYGYPKDVSPNIDRFAAESTVFEDAYTTSSWTWPSTASLFTSLPPDAHGVKSNASCTLDQSLTTIAEVLQDRGYTTAAFVGNPIVSSTRYFDQGFETFDETAAEFRMSDTYMPDALDWLEKHAPLRFFMYLHLVDPHTPHRPSPTQMERLGIGPAPESWPESGLDGIRRGSPTNPGTEITPELTQYANDLYDVSVATGDMWFGKLLEKIDELALDDRTIIVLTSDHGEELLDRGFRGHGHNLYPELVRAPLIIHVPGTTPSRRQGVVSNRHVPTTIAALCDVGLPGFGRPLDILNDVLPDEAMFETTKGEWWPDYRGNQQLLGLRRGSKTVHWRYSETDIDQVERTDLRIYDDQGDPTSQRDLILLAEPEARESAARMREILEEAQLKKPGGIAGVGQGGVSVLQGISYMGNDDDEEEDEENQ